MPVLGNVIVLRDCVVRQASRQVHQLVRRYTDEAGHPYNFDPLSSDPNFSTPPVDPIPEKITYTPSSPPTPTDPAPRLSPAGKAGIITACIIIVILLFLLTLELAYFGRQRRARAVQQAQREVEQGDVELNDTKGNREIKENAVLESQVEIVIEGDEDVQGGNMRESWVKGWMEEADGEGGVWGSERKGMSLQRREY